jgi:acetyltransferase-like isoleucine patch superfamily enzyme
MSCISLSRASNVASTSRIPRPASRRIAFCASASSSSSKPDYAQQKRSRLSWMPRLWSNNASKHRTDDAVAWQRELQATLSALETCTFGAGAFIADDVHLFAERGRAIVVGDESCIAAGGYIHGPCVLGANVSINCRCTIEGGSQGVQIGDDTRIGPNFSAFAFEHVFESPDALVREQGVTSKGITIGRDCWIGANVSVTDGVSIGDHAVIGIGAVVTRDVPAWSVSVGVPARVIKYRKKPTTE